MEIFRDYSRFKAACTEFRAEFTDKYFTAGRLFCHPFLDGVIYVPCSQEEAKSNSVDICRMSDMLLMSADGDSFEPFKIAEARKIAAENGKVYIANLLFDGAFEAEDWMIDGKHDTLIISEEHMKKEGKPYAPVTPLTNVVQPFKKLTNYFIYKKGTPEEPAVLSDKDVSEKMEGYLDELMSEFVSPEIIGETEFEIFGTKISCDKNESRCKELDRGLDLCDRLKKDMEPHAAAFKSADIDFDIKSYTAKLFVKLGKKCGVTADEKEFTSDDTAALKEKFRKLVSEKNGYGFKYSAPDKEKFADGLKAAELSTASPEELKKDIAALLRVRPAYPAVFNMARAASPADAEAVENVSLFWNSAALTPVELGEYLEESYIPADCRDAEGKLNCGGARAALISEDIKAAAAKYKLKNAPVFDELDTYCKEYEIAARTYNGTVFDTVADMEKAVKNEAELADKCSDLSALDADELKQLRKYIYDMKLDKKTTGKYLLKIKLAMNNCEENQLKLLCTGLTLKTPEELDVIMGKISDDSFDEVVAAPYIAQVKDAVLTAQLKELSEMFKSIPDKAKADELEKVLASGKYDKMFTRHFTAKIAGARDGFAREELSALCKGISEADNKALDDMLSKLDAVKCREALKAPYKKDIAARKQELLTKEVEGVFAGIKTADKAKIDGLRAVIASAKYPAALTDKYKSQLDERETEIKNAEFIKKCDTIPQMNKADLDKIIEELKAEKCPEDIAKKYLPMTEERAKALLKAELSEMCKDIPSMDFAKLDALEKTLKEDKYPEELTSGYFDTIKARRKALYNKEADELCKNIGNMQKPELASLTEKLKDEKFDPAYVKKYFDEIDKRFNKIETDKLDSMCKDIEKLKKPELEKLSADIADLGFKKENTASYLEKIRSREITLMKAEMESLCKNIATTPRKELSKLREALSGGDFDKELSAKYIKQIDERTETLIKQELADLCKNIQSAPKDKLMSMKIAISETPEYKEPGKAYAEQIESRLKQIDKAEFDKQMASIEKLTAEELDKFEDELDKRKPALDQKLYEASAAKLKERREFLQKEELEKLCGDISKLDIKKLSEIKEKISEGDFIPEVTFPYIKKIDEAATNLHVQYYTKLTENINSLGKPDLIVLLEKINKNENHAPDDMLQRYIGRVNSKIREVEANILAEKCKNLGTAGEHRCFELIKDINDMDIDADNKKRFINQVELHITNLKTVERDGYVSLLKKLMDENNIRESQFYIPGISKSFDSIYLKIQNTYARTEQFELPVVAHEFTPGHPEDSYLLTTNFLYGMGKTSGLLHIPVEQIERFEGKGGLFGASLKVVERGGKTTELPSNIEKKLYEATAKVLNGVLAAIQKSKTDAKLKEAEEIKAAEEARLLELEQERKDIEEARKRAEEAEKAAAAPKPEPVPEKKEAAPEKKEPVPEKKPEPIKPIKPIEVVVSPIPEVKPIKPIESAKPAEPVKPVQPAEAPKPVEPAKPAQPAAAPKPVEPAKPVQPAAAPKPVEPAKPVQPAAAPKPVEPAKPVQPAAAPKPAEPAKPKIKFCDQCGAKIASETAKFCAECGNKLVH
ncbi:MAG: hypothetical protein PUI48_10875 [Oscillospiraceae bacterium]|nr:hypothetical protein [Oscillospiraceae bacterium]MDD7277927.1 hypothetical protein [Oscillospiraceae bacterium]MDY6209277.1 hypothetical protein [Oscillospiraceae bacterium]